MTARREFLYAGAGALLSTRGMAAGRIARLENKGVLVRDCTIPGETRADDVTPAHPNGIQVSRDKWLIVYATRGFRGVDDDRSIVYQLRQGAFDGKVIREGLLARSGVRETTHFLQHGHPVAFGVPKDAYA